MISMTFLPFTTSMFYQSLFLIWPNMLAGILHFLAAHIAVNSFYSGLKNVKAKTRSVLTDEHFSGIHRIAASTVAADVDFLCKQKQCQISH